MEQFLLQAVVAEAAARLLEQEVLRVTHLGRQRYVLRFATRSHDNLLVSARPDLPRVHLLARDRRLREEPPDRFAALLDAALGGAVLTAFAKRPWDRVVEMRFRLPAPGGERRLVVELFGRSSNILLLDGEGVILGHARDLEGAPRAPRAGACHEPPPVDEALAGLPVGPDAIPLIRSRFGDAAAFLRRVSPSLVAESERAAAGVPAAERAEALLHTALVAAAGGAGWAPRVRSSRPLGEFPEGEAPGRDDIVVLPLDTGARPDDVVTPFASASEAAEAGFGLVESRRDFAALRDHHAALVRREIERLTTLVRRLEGDLERAGHGDRFRRDAEAILAGSAAARVEGSTAVVPDPYHPEGPPLRIAIDAALSLQENAQALFARYKKGKRGVVAITARLATVRGRLDAWKDLAAPAAAVRGRDDLEALRAAMARLGVVHVAKPRETAAPPARDTPARVRRHVGPDGLDILVGKSADENDTLTFRVASPWDFWLHAAGHAGAHVVVRNPGRLKTIPPATLRAAAEIAAFYSGARGEGKVDVHYTQRKHVRRRKGAPAGQVLLRRFRSIQVAPRLPAEPAGEA